MSAGIRYWRHVQALGTLHIQRPRMPSGDLSVGNL